MSRRRMFYIIFNIYIFNLFTERLAINSNHQVSKREINGNANRTHPFIFSWSAIIGPTLFFTRYSDRQSSEQSNRKLISLHNNGRGRKTCTRICRLLVAGNMFRLETCMSSLVKVPPYSKWNFQGKIVFNSNWCNNFKKNIIDFSQRTRNYV
jgi:hypothetical protein